MRSRPRLLLALAAPVLSCGWLASVVPECRAAEAAKQRRALAVDDYFAIRQLDDPQISPDGRWIAYTATTQDLEEDEARSRIWMVPAGGGEAIPLTAEDEDSSSPRWSPDGRRLAAGGRGGCLFVYDSAGN